MILLGWIVVFLLGVIVGILLNDEDFKGIEVTDKSGGMTTAEAAAYVQKRLVKSARRPWVARVRGDIKRGVGMEKTTELKAARKVTLEAWKAEAIELFGEDPKQWRFKCPNCGHIQTPGDFIKLKLAGISMVDSETAWFSCIGRFDTRIPDDQIGEIGDDKQPCNYTLGGLFVLAETLVIRDGEKPRPVFEFAS